MSDGAVSRDELKAMVDVQSKNVEQLTVIANHLATIVDRENKIYERLYNGLAKDISGSIIGELNERCMVLGKKIDDQQIKCNAVCTGIGTLIRAEIENSSISKDIGHVKWFVGIVGLVIIVASVVVNGIVRHNTEDIQFKKVAELIESNARAISLGHSTIITKG